MPVFLFPQEGQKLGISFGRGWSNPSSSFCKLILGFPGSDAENSGAGFSRDIGRFADGVEVVGAGKSVSEA